MNARSSVFMTFVTCSALLLGAVPCGAADRIFVTMTGSKHGDIKGEAVSKLGSMEVLNFADEYAHIMSNSGTGGGSGKLERTPIVFTKRTDKATPIIFEAFATGEALPSVVFNFVRDAAKGGEIYYTIKLGNARIVRLKHAASSDAPLVETVSLLFERIEKTSRSVSADGKVSLVVGAFDFATNSK